MHVGNIRLIARDPNSTSNDNEPEQAALIAALEQSAADGRALIDLRFKHFTSFLALNSFLGLGVLLKRSPTIPHPYLAAFGIVLACLFWLLDHRTRRLYHFERDYRKELETLLQIPDPITPASKHVSPGVVTNLIFVAALGFWVGATIYFSI